MTLCPLLYSQSLGPLFLQSCSYLELAQTRRCYIESSHVLASVAASETGSRLGAPFSSPEWTVGQAIPVAAPETGPISQTPPPTQATSVAATDPRLLTGDQCLICLVKDGDLRKCKHCSARMHPSCQDELQKAGTNSLNEARGLRTRCPYW
jgi:hypothetical protein